MDHAFDTPRISVYFGHVQIRPDQDRRMVFVAFRHDEDRPMVCATALVWLNYDNWVDWIEVSTEHRQQGIGKELLRGIEDYIGELTADGTTPEGEALLDSYERTPE